MAKKKVETIDLTNAGEPEINLPMEGIGDAIAKVTDFLGIEKCAPCEDRQSRYNQMFPWLKAVRHLRQEEGIFILDISGRKLMQSNEVDRLFSLYSELFSPKRPIKRCNCPGTVVKMIETLKKLV